MLGVRLDTVKSWSLGRNPTPVGVIAELRLLYAGIERAAGEALAVLDVHAPGDAEIELGLAADDAEAQSLGWPCVNAHTAVLGLVIARCGRPVRIVPRGSTPATEAATAAAQGLSDRMIRKPG